MTIGDEFDERGESDDKTGALKEPCSLCGPNNSEANEAVASLVDSVLLCQKDSAVTDVPLSCPAAVPCCCFQLSLVPGASLAAFDIGSMWKLRTVIRSELGQNKRDEF